MMTSSPTLSTLATEKADDHSHSSPPSSALEPAPQPKTLARWTHRLEFFDGFESRGIARVLSSERNEVTTTGFVYMTMLWLGANVSANNLAVGLLGPLMFKLGFVDSALCATLGLVTGSIPPSYISTWGPMSGNRTLINARYYMGYYPSKVIVALGIIMGVGYGVIDCIIGGQILSAVADGKMSIVVGIIIVAVASWLVTFFGMSLFHVYERWSWIPITIVLFVLVGSAGPKFDSTVKSQGDSATINANRLSFFSLCLAAPVSWSIFAADYYVYYPETTSRWKTFIYTFTGQVVSNCFVFLLGVGLASGTLSNATLAAAYDVSSGALIVAGFDGLGGFGKFCGVIVAFGEIANNVPGSYSAALMIQMLGKYPQRIPRWFWASVCAVIYTALAAGGQNSLLEIISNFVSLMGYWVVMFLAIVLEENVCFHWNRPRDWTVWADWKQLPLGIAAFSSFLIGWVGLVLGMDQAWYVGPVGRMVGSRGVDLGLWMGSGFVLVVYPPLRALELGIYGR